MVIRCLAFYFAKNLWFIYVYWLRNILNTYEIKIYISFTLYPAHSRVGRGNLVLRHSVPQFPPNSGGIACWAELNNTRFASTPEGRNGNIHLSKYFISSRGDRTHNQSVLQWHFVPLRHGWPTSLWGYFSLNIFIQYVTQRIIYIGRKISLYTVFFY